MNNSGCGGILIIQGLKATCQYPEVLFHLFQGVEATCQQPLVILFDIFQGVEATCQRPLVVLFHIFQGVEATYQRPLVVLFHLTSLCRTGGTPSVFGRSTGTPAASSTSSSWTSN